MEDVYYMPTSFQLYSFLSCLVNRLVYNCRKIGENARDNFLKANGDFRYIGLYDKQSKTRIDLL